MPVLLFVRAVAGGVAVARLAPARIAAAKAYCCQSCLLPELLREPARSAAAARTFTLESFFRRWLAAKFSMIWLIFEPLTGFLKSSSFSRVFFAVGGNTHFKKQPESGSGAFLISEGPYNPNPGSHFL